MNELEKLNERIAQLTELVKTGSEAIKSMKAALEAAEKERDRLADQRREQEPKFERKVNEEFYYIEDNGSMEVCSCYDGNDIVSTNQFKGNNYFHTEERAQEVADKINLLLKLERLHDIYCPDYVPDWKNQDEPKYFVCYDNQEKYYAISSCNVVGHKSDVFFATIEIARKVRDILNTELVGDE